MNRPARRSSVQIALLGMIAALLCACGPKPEQDEMVRSFFDNVRTERYDAIQDYLAPNLKTADVQTQLADLRRQYIPTAAPTGVTRINWRFNTVFGGDSTATFVHRYEYPDRVLLVTTSTRAAPNGPTLIEGFHVNVTPLTDEVRGAGEFSFENKSNVQLAFFGAMVLSGVLMLAALLGTIFTKGFKRKWLFALVALLGAPVFLMNWTTGEWGPTLTAGLINLGTSRGMGPLDPWMLKFHLPIGAIVVLSLLWPRWVGLYRDAPKVDESSGTES